MKGVLKFFKKNAIFLLLYSISSFLIFVLKLNFSKEKLHLLLTSTHNSLFDSFFSIITNIGDGIFVLIAGVLITFYKVKNGILIISSFLLTGFIVQILKNYVFPQARRPFLHFKNPDILHQVKDVNIHIHNSFPSGHTASAFVLFFSLSLVTGRKCLQMAFFVLAALVSYSRVYLSQHFVEDIWAGSTIAIFITTLLYYIIFRKETHLN
jgi:membrane-associated phospholipid phosphatase